MRPESARAPKSRDEPVGGLVVEGEVDPPSGGGGEDSSSSSSSTGLQNSKPSTGGCPSGRQPPPPGEMGGRPSGNSMPLDIEKGSVDYLVVASIKNSRLATG